MDLDGARAQVEELLKCFLMGTQNVALTAQILEIEEPPVAWRDRVRAAESLGRAWVAWSTDRGPMAAWGSYDVEGSRRLRACVLHIEWFPPRANITHSGAHCYPKRPTEWIGGRGVSEDAH